MKKLFSRMRDEVRKIPVIIKFDENKWFALKSFDSEKGAVMFIFYSSAYSQIEDMMIDKVLSSKEKVHQIWPVFLEDDITLEDFIQNHYENLEKEPPIYPAKEVTEAIRNRVKQIGYSKFAAFINSFIPNLRMTTSQVKKLLESLEETLDFVTAITLLYAIKYPSYRVPKEFPASISLAIEKLLTAAPSKIVVKESNTNKRVEISMDRVMLPTKWGADERILLYDVILREYSTRPRTKILLIRGGMRLKLPNKVSNEVIVISPSRLRELTHLDKYSVSRILDKFSNLLEDFVIPVGVRENKYIFKLQKLIVELTVVDGSSGLIVVESDQLKDLKDTSHIIGATDFEKIISELNIPKDQLLKLKFYRLTSFAEKLLQSSKSNRVFVESALFSRLKIALPSKAQDAGARFLERIIQKGKRAYLTIEEIANLTGRRSWLKYRMKSHVIDQAVEYLKKFKAYGIIENYQKRGDGFEIQL